MLLVYIISCLGIRINACGCYTLFPTQTADNVNMQHDNITSSICLILLLLGWHWID